MVTKILSSVSALVLTLALPFALTEAACAEGISGLPPSLASLQANVTYHYNYSVKNLSGMDSARDGSLALRFNPDGIITGYYDPGTGGIARIPVTGNVDGTSLWLDLGASNMHLLQVNATLSPNGAIDGTAFSDHRGAGYAFDATLAAR